MGRTQRWWKSKVVCAHLGALAIASGALAAEVYPNITYSSPAPNAPAATQLLDLYLPVSVGDPLPESYTIVLVHGGGYSGGDKAEIAPICSALADRGFAVISPNYRLLNSTMTASGVGTFPQTTCDILNVVHWIRNEGQQIGLPTRVILGGFSAGATISLNAAMAAGDPRFNVLPASGPRGYAIDGAVGGFGRYDLTWNSQVMGMPSYVYQFLGVPWSYTGPTNSSWLLPSTWALMAQASAATFVDSCSPPTVLYHGMSDSLVPSGNSTRLNQVMVAAGAPVQPHLIIGGVHDYSVFGPTAQAQAQSIADAAEWISRQAQSQCGRTAAPALDPQGVCCTPDGACVASLQSACATAWLAQPACTPNPCPQPPPQGACCAPNGACTPTVQSACPGLWTVDGACEPNACPQPPQGACCSDTGACVVLTQFSCPTLWIAGMCQPNPCPNAPPPGSCCAPSGMCEISLQNECGARWTYQGVCSPIACPHPGACCMGSICAIRLPDDCGPGQRFAGPDAACNVAGNHSAPCCHADFNQDGALQVADIFAYLNAWFAGDPRARVTGTFGGPLTVQDVFEYLNAWFTGC